MIATTGFAIAQTRATNAPIAFDIPSQPLHLALGRYIDATGLDALYDTNLAAGRISGAIRGMLAPDEALKKLLSGTGLAAEFVAERTFILLPAPADAQAVQPPPSPAHRRYSGLIQAGVTDALCRSGGGRPWEHRFTAVFWIAPDGAVERARRLGSTGTGAVDEQIDATLRGVRFSEPPPANFQQPVLLLIVPQGPGVKRGCGDANPGLRSAGFGR